MKVVIDTNIIFSAILNTEGAIADLLLSDNPFDFYAPSYIWNELSEHENKLLKMLKLKFEEQLHELKFMITQNIRFISEFQISEDTWGKAHSLTADIDFDDIAFIALTFHLDGILWTGDKKLRSGLAHKGFTSVINTQELLTRLHKE